MLDFACEGAAFGVAELELHLLRAGKKAGAEMIVIQPVSGGMVIGSDDEREAFPHTHTHLGEIVQSQG